MRFDIVEYIFLKKHFEIRKRSLQNMETFPYSERECLFFDLIQLSFFKSAPY